MCDNNKENTIQQEEIKSTAHNKKTPKINRERKRPEDQEDAPLYDDVKMCMQKKKRVVEKLDSLGIGNVTSKFRKLQK